MVSKHGLGTGTAFVDRRQFVQTVGAGVAVAALPGELFAKSATATAKPENLVAKLYDSLTPKQRDTVCFPWNFKDDRGVLRRHVSANWHVTKPGISNDFYTKDQQELIEAIFFGLYHPDWHDRIRKQLRDDAGGFGKGQSIAIIGEPGSGKSELVVTGRHLTARCDGEGADNFAFGGPIFYGHAAGGANEKPDHPGNVFWPQAVKANSLYKMLDGKQRKAALLPFEPAQDAIQFEGTGGDLPGLKVAEMSADQQAEMREVLRCLVEPYRESDRVEVDRCLEAQGGLEECHLSFYQTGDIGDDKVWDNWRLEGPSFVWYFRGAPHVHVWVNVANTPKPKVFTG